VALSTCVSLNLGIDSPPTGVEALLSRLENDGPPPSGHYHLGISGSGTESFSIPEPSALFRNLAQAGSIDY
jgi:hypothetical protein